LLLFVAPAKAGAHNHRWELWGMNDASHYFVYILASKKHGTLYIGVCNDIRARLQLHRTGKGSKFVKTYGVTRLVYVEQYATPLEAIQREKQMKEWHRDWKIRLIEENNPDWRDLSHLL
jgi:putative endonuclease